MSISFARPTAQVSCILDSKLYVKKSAFYLIYQQKKNKFQADAMTNKNRIAQQIPFKILWVELKKNALYFIYWIEEFEKSIRFF